MAESAQSLWIKGLIMKTIVLFLLFSREHYIAAAEGYLRGIDRRIACGLSPDVRSVVMLPVSRRTRLT
jgi:hypothetical protein